jgi:hypothetical protein
MELCLEITDDYSARNEMVKRLYDHACRWLDLAIGRAPIEMQTILQVSWHSVTSKIRECEPSLNTSTLQKYLRESRDTLLLDNVEMGAGVALRYAKAISRLDRQEGRFWFRGLIYCRSLLLISSISVQSQCPVSAVGNQIARICLQASLQPRTTIRANYRERDLFWTTVIAYATPVAHT